MPSPNIIIILADDLGYSDISPFGGELDTPALQRLAEHGTRMSSYYVTPRCSPSRAALLTGQQPHAVGIGVLTTNDAPNGYPGSLSTDAPTLAERLREEGYVTGLFGKWHLSSDISTPNRTWPQQRGFDEFHGILPGAASYYQPPLMHGEARIPARELGDDYYFTDDISEHGADFVRRHAREKNPFFMYLSYTAPHWPLQAREKDIAKYRKRYALGWTEARTGRLQRLRNSGLLPEDTKLSQAQGLASWKDDESAAWQVERMAVYAAQVEAMDRGIGKVIEELEMTGEFDNTIILFFSDNGGCAEELPPETASKFLDEVICPRTTPAGESIRIGNDPEVMPGPATTYASYGENWATVSNTPFRLWKRWVHEGGISSPFIVSWPDGGVPAGVISHALGHVTDIVPTVMAAAGASANTPGQSLLPAWKQPTDERAERTLCWEHIGNAAIRKGKWKLVREWGAAWELYDISTDRTESMDLSAALPDLVKELASEWTQWAEDNGVLPWNSVLQDYRLRGKPVERAIG